MVRNVIANSMHNIDHDAAKGHIKGRAAAVRLASGIVGYDLGGLYFPPAGSLRRDKYHEVCTDIVKWFDKHLSKLPQRSVPLFAVDLNQDVPNPREERVDPTVVGQHATSKSKNGVPHQLMQVMKAHGLCFLNTYHDNTATYYGNWNNKKSRNDFFNRTVQHAAVLQEDARTRKNRKKVAVHQHQGEKRPLPNLR